MIYSIKNTLSKLLNNIIGKIYNINKLLEHEILFYYSKENK